MTMSTPEEFIIACYMGWSGAEATFPFSNREDYDNARAALEKLAVGHERANALPSSYGGVTDLYFIDAKDRDAFNRIMDVYTGPR
jgi:hypothetical protein